jgi:hypothetical protein
MSSKETGTLRSDFIVHWTGRRIEEKYQYNPEAKCEKYVKRLRDILREGLRMKIVEEQVHQIQYSIPMTCFTEIKLSAIHKHTERYGCLRFGFTRSFVMKLLGAPVQYVAATQHDDIITEKLNRLRGVLKHLKDCGAYQALEAADIDKELEKKGAICPERKERNIFPELINAADTSICFTKRMSECTSPHDFRYLDEAEWRILYTGEKYIDGKKKVTDFPKCLDGKDPDPIASITFDQSDLKILILPDEDIRKRALDDKYIKNWLPRNPVDLPIIFTVKECTQF